NYCSAPINNMGWHMTVEKLIGCEVPKRVDYMRVIMMELARIADHMVCNGVTAMDAGAITGLTYLFREREAIYEMYEQICGARMTTNMGRIGGFERDFNPKFHELLQNWLKKFPKIWGEFCALNERNRIFMDRTIKVGGISAGSALSYGFAGTKLRAAGVDYDVRVANAFRSYLDFDFIIAVGSAGDTHDRFMVRQQDVWESLNFIGQADRNLPE